MNHSGRDLAAGGLCVALSVVIPWLFHVLGLGSAFLPMFYPMLAAGFLTSFPVGAAAGFLSPLASAVLTGMPPFYPPMAFVMSAEGLVLGAMPPLLRKKLRLGIRTSLGLTLFADRLVLAAAVVVVARWMDLPAGFLGWASVLKSMPGLVVIFIVLPPLLSALEKNIAASPFSE